MVSDLGLAAATDLVKSSSEPALLDLLVSAAKVVSVSDFSVALFLGTDGLPSLMSHEGMTPHEVSSLPHLPRPVGLVGVVLEGETLRLASTAEHPRAIGFPPSHAAMGPILAVPLRAGVDVLGAIYLARKVGASLYSQADEDSVRHLCDIAAETVRRFRRQSASEVIIDRLSAGGQSEVTSMDGTIRRLLATARSVLNTDVAFISRIDGGTQEFAYIDAGADGSPLGEGTVVDLDTGFCALMLKGDIANSVPDLTANPATAGLAVTAELELHSYCGVPIHLDDGALYGTICGLNGSANEPLTGSQLQSLRVIADLVGTELTEQQHREALYAKHRDEFAAQIADSQRQVFLQPIVSLATGRPTGYEALSRFSDRWSNFRRPDVVFAEAAQFGLGLSLELSMARLALESLTSLPPDYYLSVNLSPEALLLPETFDLLSAAVTQRPGQVVVELTEHEQVADYPALLRVLSGLRDRGLRLAIDDTGAGYSSLQHVTTMRPDVLKLDIAFVRDIHLDPGRRAVARAMASFAADIGASLVAEGVEVEEELAVVRQLGATHAQGYLLGRPAPVNDVVCQPVGT